MRGLKSDDAVGNAAELRGLKWHSLSISLLGYLFCATTPGELSASVSFEMWILDNAEDVPKGICHCRHNDASANILRL